MLREHDDFFSLSFEGFFLNIEWREINREIRIIMKKKLIEYLVFKQITNEDKVLVSE